MYNVLWLHSSPHYYFLSFLPSLPSCLFYFFSQSKWHVFLPLLRVIQTDVCFTSFSLCNKINLMFPSQNRNKVRYELEARNVKRKWKHQHSLLVFHCWYQSQGLAHCWQAVFFYFQISSIMKICYRFLIKILS